MAAFYDGQGVTMDGLKEVTVVESTGTSFSQTSPVIDTWYNVLSISLSAGYWRLSYAVTLSMSFNSSNQWRFQTTLSTANNTESDVQTTEYLNTTVTTGGTSNSITKTFSRNDLLYDLPSGDTLYLNTASTVSGSDTINQSTKGSNYIRAVPMQAWTT